MHHVNVLKLWKKALSMRAEVKYVEVTLDSKLNRILIHLGSELTIFQAVEMVYAQEMIKGSMKIRAANR